MATELRESTYIQEAGDTVDGAANRAGPTERHMLLHSQNNGSNGEMLPSADAREAQRNLGNAHTPIETSCSGRIKREMNAVLCSRLRLWMVIFLIIALIIALIMISLVICSATYGDEDEKFDPSTFKVPQYFRGSFQLPNLVFTEELSDISSSESQPLVADLEGKLDNFFGSSPALGRYFSRAEINSFRNGSVVSVYRLTFLVPDEDLEQLTAFTLSREMVYNVFRQFLYDQDPHESEPMYIDPVSLSMFEGTAAK